MLIAVFQIARNTFRENLRQPIYLLVLLTALVLIGILPAFTLFVFREQQKLVTDTALATMLVFGWVLAVLIASHAVTREINRGTALLLLSKPVPRLSFILGKTIGLFSGLSIFCLLTGLAALFTLRIAADQFQYHKLGFGLFFGTIILSCLVGGLVNYVRRSSFPMAAVLSLTVLLPLTAFAYRWIPIGGESVGYSWNVFPALVLVSLAVGVLGVLAVALSTRLGLIQNMITCGVIFITGLVSDYLLADLARNNLLIAVIYKAVPNWQLFWTADALAAGKAIPLEYIFWSIIYFLMFTTLFVAVGAMLFAHREVGEQRLME
ncbi:MAG: hypothetical protein R6V56_01575 [Lentisphaeria bacterium]